MSSSAVSAGPRALHTIPFAARTPRVLITYEVPADHQGNENDFFLRNRLQYEMGFQKPANSIPYGPIGLQLLL